MAYLLSEAPKDIHLAVVGIHSIGKVDLTLRRRDLIESYTRLLSNSQPDSTTPLRDSWITVPADGDEMAPWTAPSLSGSLTRLHLWHNSWGSQQPDWFHAKEAFIVCFALDKRVTYESVQEVWIPMIRVYRNSPYAPVLIVGIRRQSHGILDDGAEARKDGISSDKVHNGRVGFTSYRSASGGWNGPMSGSMTIVTSSGSSSTSVEGQRPQLSADANSFSSSSLSLDHSLLCIIVSKSYRHFQSLHWPSTVGVRRSNINLESISWHKLDITRRQGKCGTIRNRNIIRGSNGFTINGGTYANGNAHTTTQYNFLVINVSGSPPLINSDDGDPQRLPWLTALTNHTATSFGRLKSSLLGPWDEALYQRSFSQKFAGNLALLVTICHFLVIDSIVLIDTLLGTIMLLHWLYWPAFSQLS
ncbi:hypothetical protein BKA70DRAFT_1404018 [Coprinopsis sp. MPI-PUGE-AT-0042]|nr:hypothetical protein BKA70DRAFT_1404018 [Coprinopsis sp. MPI-PUGE-AT-0042]